jgi:uncharacterized protein (DUF2235 family)
MVIYAKGVGTGRGSNGLARLTDRVFGGLFGWGLENNIIDVYRSLVLCYEPGDEVFVFGFSRGAYTARSLIGLIRSCGIVPRWDISAVEDAMAYYRDRDISTKPSEQSSIEKRARFSPVVATSQADVDYREANQFPDIELLKLKYLGVWDTVGAMGVPGIFGIFAKLFNWKYRFHDNSLSSLVQVGRHAVAIDEERRLFPPTLWTPPKGVKDTSAYSQLWFVGDHAAVGGGGSERGLSNITYEWIAQGAKAQKLGFHPDLLRRAAEGKDPFAGVQGHTDMSFLGGLLALFKQHRTALKGLPVAQTDLAPTAQQRLDEDPTYRPETLRHCWPSDKST